MNVVRPRVSLADLERAPEDGRRYELYDGEAFVVPTPPFPDISLSRRRLWSSSSRTQRCTAVSR